LFFPLEPLQRVPLQDPPPPHRFFGDSRRVGEVLLSSTLYSTPLVCVLTRGLLDPRGRLFVKLQPRSRSFLNHFPLKPSSRFCSQIHISCNTPFFFFARSRVSFFPESPVPGGCCSGVPFLFRIRLLLPNPLTVFSLAQLRKRGGSPFCTFFFRL